VHFYSHIFTSSSNAKVRLRCPGKPLANLYFTCFTFNAMQMGQLLARDLKLAQYVHLSPRHTFTIQVMGCLVGAIMNYAMMIASVFLSLLKKKRKKKGNQETKLNLLHHRIVANQAPILKGIPGSNIWSGQNVQQFNTLAVVFSMAKDLVSVGQRYEWPRSHISSALPSHCLSGSSTDIGPIFSGDTSTCPSSAGTWAICSWVSTQQSSCTSC